MAPDYAIHWIPNLQSTGSHFCNRVAPVSCNLPRGLVYRFDGIGKWTRIDDGLPENFDIQAIDGFGAADLYSVGRRGSMWHFNGKSWSAVELPTNVNLTSVKCVDNEVVYVGGYKGVLLCGRRDEWKVIDHKSEIDDIWDLEWFNRSLYVSTMDGVFRLNGDALEPVDFGKDAPKSWYHLSAAKGVLWSIGNFDIMSFDGRKWTRVV